MSHSPTVSEVDSLALFNVLRTLAQGTPEDWIALRLSAQVPGSALAKLVAANNVSVQRNICGNDDPDVLQSLTADNADLRKLLGEATCAGKPYTDKGEFVCREVAPNIDYMRDKVADIREKLSKRWASSAPEFVLVNRVALETVVYAFRSNSTKDLMWQYARMGLGHCAAGQLGRDLDKAVFNKDIK